MVTLTEEVKVIRVGNSLRIAIHAVFCKALGILEGDTIHLETMDHQIQMSKLEPMKLAASKKRG